MNLTVKRCLMGLVAPATMFGMVWAQETESVGTVQLGRRAQAPVQVPEIEQIQGTMQEVPTSQPGVVDLGPSSLPPLPGPSGPGQPGYGNYFRVSAVDQVLMPRFIVDSRGGGLYGYNAGYSNIGAFVPYKIDDSSILFGTGMGLVTYDGRGGATVGGGWRHWMEDVDRIIGLAGFYDFDNGHAQPYQQLGLSLESLGRYVDYRVNGYLPVSNPDHVLNSSLVGTAALFGNGIGLLRTNTVEQAFSGLDAEMGGPTPFLGRYGLNAYIGGYYYMGSGANAGNFTGVSGRLLSQINEDVSFGVQVTNDHMFGLNTQFQVFMNIPNGRPGRWLRNLRVQDRLVQNVFRQNRVVARTETYSTYDAAINPNTHQAYFVANIDPNATTNGDGSVNNPFSSIANYEAISVAQQKRYDILLVRPNNDGSHTDLDTASTLNIYNGQRLLSTSVAQTFVTENLPGVVLPLPGFVSGAAPILYNSSGGNVVTLVGGNTLPQQVSGFDIVGSATGNGIFGNNNVGTIISSNTIEKGLNGVLLTGLSGTVANGNPAQFFNNVIKDNIGNGVQITNSGAAPFTPDLNLVVTNNQFQNNGNDGLQINANAGAYIGGMIGGTNTSTTTLSNTFSGNVGNGLALNANGGTLDFLNTSTSPFGIVNNTFSGNTLDGLSINTINNSIASFSVINNAFGVAGTSTSGNARYGLGLVSDSGTTKMFIGGASSTLADGTTFNPGNTFNFNAVSAINLAVSGTASLSYDILNNTISNSSTATIAPVHDAFTFSFNGTSGTDPFIIGNTSDTGVSITSVSWNLAGTLATIADSGSGAVIQPISDTFLTGLNGNAVTAGSDPLLITATGLVANNANSGLATATQLIPLTFTNFATGKTFQATSEFQSSGGSAALSSASTIGSTLSVTFSNGLTSTQKVQAVSGSAVAVSAAGDVFGTSVPGYGSGVDGIHVSASGNSTLSHAVIQSNTITGYGHYGINVETSGAAFAPNVVVVNNTLTNNGTGISATGQNVFDGGGLQISRDGSSTLDALVQSNTITSNYNYGISVLSSGTAGDNIVNLFNNTVTGNVSNGLNVATSGASVLTLNSQGNDFHGNGSGATQNTGVATSMDNVTFSSAGTSIANINLNNFVGNNAEGTGLSAISNDDSTMNLIIDSLSGAAQSAFSNNKVNGIALTGNDRSVMHANVYNSSISNNASNGISYTRNGTSLILSNITDTTINSNAANGIFYQGIGSDPTDALQKNPGQSNLINLVRDTLNNNGNSTTSTGDGFLANVYGQSSLVVNATSTTFNSNAGNGLHADMTPGAQFGDFANGIRSTFDNVDMSSNGANGIFFSSQVTGSPVQDAQSRTYFALNSISGVSRISNNGANGILMQYSGGIHDVAISGDGVAVAPVAGGGNQITTFTTAIQSNTGDGIHVDAGNFSNATVRLEKVLVGGSTAGQGNGGDGIGIHAVENQLLDPTAALPNNIGLGGYQFLYNHAGTANLIVNNSSVMNNAGNGITLYGNNLQGTGFDATNITNRTFGSRGDGSGQVNATLTNTNIVSNKGSGVFINMVGQMGGYRAYNFSTQTNVSSGYNKFVFDNVNISNNGNYGIYFEANPADMEHVIWGFFSNDPNPLPTNYPLQPQDLAGLSIFNYGENANIRDSFVLSNWMDVSSNSNSQLTLTNSRIQGNGQNHDLSNADGIKLRVGTSAYLSADIRDNVMSGNVGADLRVESFVQYNPVTKVVFALQPATHGSATTLSTVELDPTAQLDMRLTGNVGNTINITDPAINAFGTLPGNASGNGAIFPWDPEKDRFSTAPPGSVRLAQLFQIDDGLNLNSTNSFISNGVTQDISNQFFNADFYLRTVADPLFPNNLFPLNSINGPGNPFLP